MPILLKLLIVTIPGAIIVYWVSPTLFWMLTCYFGLAVVAAIIERIFTGKWPEPDNTPENPYSGPPYWGDPYGY